MSRFSEAEYELAAMQSWDHMFKGVPDKQRDLVAITKPELLEAHLKAVKGHLQAPGDVNKALGIMTEGRFRDVNDLPGKLPKWHADLNAYLREWARGQGH